MTYARVIMQHDGTGFEATPIAIVTNTGEFGDDWSASQWLKDQGWAIGEDGRRWVKTIHDLYRDRIVYAVISEQIFVND